MIETKTFEIRDKSTFIPAVGALLDVTRLPFDSQDHYLLRRAGFGADTPCVLLTRLGGGKSEYDPFAWGDRTWHVSHMFITESWHELQSGAVIDVEYILQESKQPKLSERTR